MNLKDINDEFFNIGNKLLNVKKENTITQKPIRTCILIIIFHYKCF